MRRGATLRRGRRRAGLFSIYTLAERLMMDIILKLAELNKVNSAVILCLAEFGPEGLYYGFHHLSLSSRWPDAPARGPSERGASSVTSRTPPRELGTSIYVDLSL